MLGYGASNLRMILPEHLAGRAPLPVSPVGESPQIRLSGMKSSVISGRGRLPNEPSSAHFLESVSLRDGMLSVHNDSESAVKATIAGSRNVFDV